MYEGFSNPKVPFELQAINLNSGKGNPGEGLPNIGLTKMAGANST